MSRLLMLLLLTLIIFSVRPAGAQDTAAPNIMLPVPDFVGEQQEIVTEHMDIARENLTRAKLPDGSFVPAETAEELKEPVIPVSDAHRVVNRGILTAMAEYCSLNWQLGSFVPFMESERAKGIWSDKQVAYIGLLHGLTQGSFLRLFAEGQEPCPPELKLKTQAMLYPVPDPTSAPASD